VSPEVYGILSNVLDGVFRLYFLLLMAWVILSWIPSIDRYHPIVQAVNRIVEPTVTPFRRLLPGIGPFDISPILAFAVYQVLYQFLSAGLMQLAGLSGDF
jgi:YggT family protein